MTDWWCSNADVLGMIARRVPAVDMLCFRLVCRAFRDAVAGPTTCGPRAFMRSRALVAFAWARLPAFANEEDTELLAIALSEANKCKCPVVDVLAELVDGCGCTFGVDRGARLCYVASALGRDRALAWLFQRGCECSPHSWLDCSVAAASGGHVSTMRMLHELDHPMDEGMCLAAAHGGHLPALAYAHDLFGCIPGDGPRLCAYAAAGGHLDVLKYARAHGCAWDERTCTNAATEGHFAVLRFACEHGCPIASDVMLAAAQAADVAMLRFVREVMACPWHMYTCHSAAYRGRLENVRYAHEHGCPWDGFTCSAAAGAGHVHVLRYAHEHGCPWWGTTCMAAAQGGHLSTLRYAVDHGCPWDPGLCAALAALHPDVVEYCAAALPLR
jgi:hypothetical protein